MMWTKQAAIGAVFAAVSLFGITRSTAAAADTAGSDAAAFVSAINQVRGSQHLATLTVNQQLVSVALKWSQTMATTGSISHNPSLAAAMPSGWQDGGENVGMGASEALVENAFVNSPEHYANMVDAAFNQIGVGVFVTSSGMLFVTEDFVEAPLPAPAPPTGAAVAVRSPAAASGVVPPTTLVAPIPASPGPQNRSEPPVSTPTRAAAVSSPATVAPRQAAAAAPTTSPAPPLPADMTEVAGPVVPASLAGATKMKVVLTHSTVPTAVAGASVTLDLAAILAAVALGARRRREPAVV